MEVLPSQNIIMPKNNSPAFKGGVDNIIALMDMIDRNGYGATFISQDLLGMAIPRIGAGLTRNQNKTGEKNYKFAAMEAIRELVSGPSMFLIPAGFLYCARKFFGRSHLVPVDHIKDLGDSFVSFSKNKSSEELKNVNLTKKAYYTDIYKNVLETSTNKEIATKYTDYFVNKSFEIENTTRKARKNGTAKKVTTIKNEMLEKLVSLRKMAGKDSETLTSAQFKTINGEIKDIGDFKKFTTHLTNYTDDAANSVAKALNKAKKSFNIPGFLKTLNSKRIVSRFSLNLLMTTAVILFSTQIPKLYKSVSKTNPGTIGLESIKENSKERKEADSEHK